MAPAPAPTFFPRLWEFWNAPGLCSLLSSSSSGSRVTLEVALCLSHWSPESLQISTWVCVCATDQSCPWDDQSCPTPPPPPPLGCGPPASSVRGILQVRVLEQVPFPPPGDLPDPGVKPVSPALQAGSSPLSHHGASWSWVIVSTSPLPPWKDFLRNIGDTLPLRLNVSGGDRASWLLTPWADTGLSMRSAFLSPPSTMRCFVSSLICFCVWGLPVWKYLGLLLGDIPSPRGAPVEGWKADTSRGSQRATGVQVGARTFSRRQTHLPEVLVLVLPHQLPHLLVSPTPFQEPRARVGELEPTDWIQSTACRRRFCLLVWDVCGFVCFGGFCLWGICSLFLWLRFTGTQPLLLGYTLPMTTFELRWPGWVVITAEIPQPAQLSLFLSWLVTAKVCGCLGPWCVGRLYQHSRRATKIAPRWDWKGVAEAFAVSLHLGSSQAKSTTSQRASWLSASLLHVPLTRKPMQSSLCPSFPQKRFPLGPPRPPEPGPSPFAQSWSLTSSL